MKLIILAPALAMDEAAELAGQYQQIEASRAPDKPTDDMRKSDRELLLDEAVNFDREIGGSER